MIPRWLWRRRAASFCRTRLAAWLLVLAAAPGVAGAQVRPDTVRRDTIPRDSVRVAIPPSQMEPDTLPADSLLGDSAVVATPFPYFARPRRTGFAYGSWEWDRAALQRYHGLSLLGLLEQIPGLVVTRVGDYGAPAGVSALGSGGARVRVFLDGFELDAPGFATPDLQQIGLLDIETVRVERTLGEVRVELIPVRLNQARPVTMVEAGTGAYDVKLLRALLMRGIGTRSLVTAAYELTSTRGFAFRAPAAIGAGRVRWSYALGPQTALQLEYRGESIERTGGRFPADAVRRVVLLRGRTQLRPGLMVDAMVGRTSRASKEGDPLTLPLSSIQGAARAALELGGASLEAGVRGRSGSLRSVPSPGVEVYASGSARPLPWIGAEAEVRTTTLGGQGGVALDGTVRLGGGTGPAVFASVSAGQRGLTLVDTMHVDSLLVAPDYRSVSTATGAVRLGGEWVRGGAVIGVAGVALAPGTVVPFGLPFDRGRDAVQVDAAQGLEGRALLPVPGTRGAVRLEGSFAVWPQRGGRPYLPSDMGRLALGYHGLFYDGQLEPSLRVAVERRGATLAPGPQGSGFTTETAPYALANLDLQLRILDVRAFLVWENLTNYRGALDVPGFPLPGTRFVYGVRWVFQN